MNQEKKVFELEIDDILPNRFQPRFKFQEQAITELSESIREHGVINPILVRKLGDKYEIIAGERRYKASVLAGKTTIPAIVTDLNDKDSAEVALIENVQRQDLTPIEEAVSYKKILDMGYLTQEQLADKLGKTQSTISNKLRLLNLDDDVQEALLDSKISERHARSILKIANKSKQRDILNQIITNRLTVKKTDELINQTLQANPNVAIPYTINHKMFDNIQEPAIQSSSAIEFIEPQVQNSFNPSSNNEKDMLNFLSEEKQPEKNISIPLEEDPSVINITNINGFNSNQNNQEIVTSPIIEENQNIKEISENNANELNEINTMLESIPNKINPGFVDVDYIEKNAKDIVFDNNTNKEIKNDMLLNNQEINNVNQTFNDNYENNIEQSISKNKFFNFVAPDEQETTVNQEKEDEEEFNFKPQIENAENMKDFLNQDSGKQEEIPQQKIVDLNSLDIFGDTNIDITPTPQETKTNENVNTEEYLEEEFEEIKDEPKVLNYPADSIIAESVNKPEEKQEQQNELKPTNISAMNLRTAINTIRSCAETIEKYGFNIETEEFDFDDMYQVIFKIKK